MKECRPENMVFAPHWYDLRALFSKSFGNFSVNVQGLSRVCGNFFQVRPVEIFYVRACCCRRSTGAIKVLVKITQYKYVVSSKLDIDLLERIPS